MWRALVPSATRRSRQGRVDHVAHRAKETTKPSGLACTGVGTKLSATFPLP